MSYSIEQLQATYSVTNRLVHVPKSSAFGAPYFGEITTYTTEKTATGFELAESILIAQRHVTQILGAVASMQAILNGGSPAVLLTARVGPAVPAFPEPKE